MATDPAPDAVSARLRRAAARLGVAPDASPAAVRAALLRRVAEAGGVPSPACRRAWFTLAAGPAAANVVEPDEAERLATGVDDFTESFWLFPPTARRQQWRQLWADCDACPALRAWLAHLAAGLELPGQVAEDDSQMAELAEHVCRSFTLRPAARAGLRHRLLQRFRADLPAWQAAERRLRERHPELASLAPELLLDVQTWLEPQARRRQAWARAVVSQLRTAALVLLCLALFAGLGAVSYWWETTLKKYPAAPRQADGLWHDANGPGTRPHGPAEQPRP
jgi:hypothetical protein